MNSQDIIDAFFIQDGQIQASGSVKRSVLLALEKDFEFCILLPRVWTNESQSKVKVSTEQYQALQEIIPSFTVISLFCTAIDVLARVIKKRAIPGQGESNGDYFRDCAESWFDVNHEEAQELWLLRNGISHGYRLTGGRHATRQFGHGRIMKQRENDNVWEFYLHAMYGAIQTAKRKIYDHLSAEEQIEKQITATYLENNGFFFTR